MPPRPEPPDRPPVGAGRVLAVAYGFFTLAAGARSGVQLATQFDQAPLAYLLSAVAAAIYLSGMLLILLADRRPSLSGPARTLCLVELAGVVLVGAASLLLPRAFPDATVWSGFGAGYGYVPAVLPVLALYWLHRATARSAPRSVAARWRRRVSRTRAGRAARGA